MSYRATISFKVLADGEIYPFFQRLKNEIAGHLDDIAKDEFLYMPSVRYAHLYDGVRAVVKDDADEAWARGVFSMRFFYLAEHKLLGVFGVPSEIQGIFDDSIYFQNSCDQDYEFEEWRNIPIFAEIADKWKSATDEEVREKYFGERCGECDDDDIENNLDYYRRTFAYDEIWGMCEDYMWHDDQAVHLSMFGFYDYSYIKRFVFACREECEKWRKDEK